MEVRTFGGTDLQVSSIGLGCARIGGIFQTEPRAFDDLVARALDAGITFFDTADMYSQGESEAVLGRALRGRRQQVVIASKAGYKLPGQRRWIARIKPLVRPLVKLLGLRRDQLPSGLRGQLSQDFSGPYLARAVEGSLKRLRTDRLDLLQLHSPPREVIERGEWIEALAALKRAGKIRWWGVACATVEDALAALAHPGVSSLQVTVNLFDQRAISALLPRARERGVGVIAREVLANGLLAKPVADADLQSYCSTPEEAALRSRQLTAVRALATSLRCTPAQLALHLVQRLEGVPVTLIGARTAAQLQGTLASLRAPEVEPEPGALLRLAGA